MMIKGDAFDVAAFMSFFMAVALGLLGWAFAGLYFQFKMIR